MVIPVWVNKCELSAEDDAIIAQLKEPARFLCDGSTPGFHFVPGSLIVNEYEHKAVKKKPQSKKKRRK